MTTRTGRALHASQVLHCNLNVVDVARASVMYQQGLGLSVRMRSESKEGDSTAMGIDGATHSVAWFLYDHRGGHVSPAIELVEWLTPPTAGVTYDDPTVVGMQSLMFAVPSFVASTVRLLLAGARSTMCRARADGHVIFDSELLDRDGVRIELTKDPGVSAPTLTGVRLNCVALDEAVRWYGQLGWDPVGDKITATRDGVDAPATIQRVALPTHPFQLHLTQWPDTDPGAHAHQGANARGLFRMALAVDDVRAAYEESRQGGEVHIGEPTYVLLPGTPLGGLWVSFFRDPNGVTVELVERITRAR